MTALSTASFFDGSFLACASRTKLLLTHFWSFCCSNPVFYGQSPNKFRPGSNPDFVWEILPKFLSTVPSPHLANRGAMISPCCNNTGTLSPRSSLGITPPARVDLLIQGDMKRNGKIWEMIRDFLDISERFVRDFVRHVVERCRLVMIDISYSRQIQWEITFEL